MSARRVIHLIRTGEIFPYTLGRFLLVRNAYSRWRRFTSGPLPVSEQTTATLFPNVDPQQAVMDLRRTAVALGLSLPGSVVRDIREYAEKSKCTTTGSSAEFHFRDVSNGRLPDGTRVALGQVRSPLECPAVRRVADDPLIRQVATQYLGYSPPHCDTRLFWSPASDLSPDERRKLAQTIDFHVDVYHYNFCYAHFYITDCDRHSGAHEMVLGSHRRKKLSWLVGSARRAREQLEAFYDKESFLVIEGAAGAGFIEDTSCYHRAIPPDSAPRLLLQMRLY